MTGIYINDLLNIWEHRPNYWYLKIVFNANHKIYNTSYSCDGHNYEFVKNVLKSLDPSEYQIELRGGNRDVINPSTGELILSAFQVRLLSDNAKALFLVNKTL